MENLQKKRVPILGTTPYRIPGITANRKTLWDYYEKDRSKKHWPSGGKNHPAELLSQLCDYHRTWRNTVYPWKNRQIPGVDTRRSEDEHFWNGTWRITAGTSGIDQKSFIKQEIFDHGRNKSKNERQCPIHQSYGETDQRTERNAWLLADYFWGSAAAKKSSRFEKDPLWKEIAENY